MNRIVNTCLIMGLLFCGACQSRSSKEPSGSNEMSILDEPPLGGLTDSIKADPKNVALYLRRAAILSQSGHYELAYADLEAVSKLSPSMQLGQQQVNLLFMMGKSDEARTVLQQLMQQYGKNPALQRRLAETYQQSKQYPEAIKIYTEVLQEDSADFETYHERGLIYLEQKDTTAALKDLEHSFALQPLQITALTLANLYAEQKNPRALELANLVIARDSAKEMIDPVFIKGVYFENIKNFPRALEMFSTCINMDWKFQEAYIEKGIIYFDQKNLDMALKQFKLAATVSNTFADAYYWQGRCYEALGKKEEALTNYARAYALDKDFKEAVEAADRVKGKN